MVIALAFLAFCCLCVAILLEHYKLKSAMARITNLEALVEVDTKGPVHKYNGHWYFWDETWSERLGPYSTEKGAKIGLAKYCKAIGVNA